MQKILLFAIFKKYDNTNSFIILNSLNLIIIILLIPSHEKVRYILVVKSFFQYPKTRLIPNEENLSRTNKLRPKKHNILSSKCDKSLHYNISLCK